MEAGALLGRLQQGEMPVFPEARALPAVGRHCVELRIVDRDVSWRIVCSVEPDVILILDVFAKKTRTTPKAAIDACRRRLRSYEAAACDEG